MDVRIRRGFELLSKKPTILIRQLPGFLHHPRTLLFLGREDNFGTQHSHETPAFYREGLYHGNDQGIPFGGANHGKPNPSIP